jgi:hypothetical protein
MSEKSKNDHDKNQQLIDVLLLQYGECWSDIRQYENLIWEIPSVTTIIVGVLIGLSATTTMFAQIVLFVVALSLNVVMTVALYKHQFFRIYRFREIEKIEETLRGLDLSIIASGARSTDKIREKIAKGIVARMPQGWVYDRIANNWIRGYMHLLTIALVLGLIAAIIE